ncbi:LysR family transcriptional regulator [Paraburkholderia sp. ZP32-5]|uniref:LysR family transcriptional regulator n=1 Tax=Paraburkholderia sp. ZP32-5 TaxID=2883245 RepID=UPI001F38B8B4|nr:LysR family transcriptional regulator [Paraburkholderia sp. ZP32-5]
MKFKLRQMEVFRAVMLTGTASGAARMLYVSQPAISRLLTHTETSIGVKLFERVGRKLVPTDSAVALFEEVQHVYDAALGVDRFVENLANQSAIELSVSCSPALGLSLLPRAIEMFHRRNPKLRIHFYTTLTIDVPNELLSKKTDLAVTLLPLNNPNLTVETIGTGRIVAAMMGDHPLASRNSISAEDLAGHAVILPAPKIAFGRFIRAALEGMGADITPAFEVPRAELACALARRSLGIALTDEFVASPDIWPGMVVKPFAQPITYDINLIYPKYSARSKAAEGFIQVLRECMQLHEAGKLFV